MKPLTVRMLILALGMPLCLFFPNSIFAQTHSAPDPDLFLDVRSYEIQKLNGSLAIPVKITAITNLNLAGMELGLMLSDPKSEGKPVTKALPKQVLEAGSSVMVTINLPYNVKNLPFHHQRLRLGVRSAGEAHWHAIAHAYVYFTPYGTAELWNATDFDNLKRVWISRIDQGGKRRPISRKEIPASDLTDEEWLDDNFPKEYLFPEGLAYGIPVRAASKKNARSGNVYSGNIRGRIVTVIDGDPIALTDIRVDIYNDKGGKIETTWTDEEGRFDIFAINVSLNADHLELYVKVHAINEAETIRVRGRGLGPTRKEFYLKSSPFLWHYQDGDVEMGDIETDANAIKGQLLHWANRARHFAEEELDAAGFSFPSQPGKKLEIMTHPWQQDMGGMFIPAAVENQLIAGGAALIPFPLSMLGIIVLENNLSNKDCLYIGEDFEEDDGTVSHEFGHNLMWHMQDKRWASLFEAGLANHTTKANNKFPDLAWTEGFANGFERIMETVNALQGHAPAWSSGLEEQLYNYDSYDNYEDSIYVIDIGGGGTRNDQALDHGFVSEYYIGHLIYDLWDGPGKMTGSGLNDRAFNDEEGLLFNDSIELSFLEIVQPILDHPGVGGGPGLFGFNQGASVINSTPEYHGYLLLDSPMDCIPRKEIHELFNFNKMHNIQDGVWSNLSLQKNYLNLDAISYLGEVETNQYKILSGSPRYKLTGTNVDQFKMDVFELSNPDNDYNLYGLGANAGFVQLLDDLEVNGGAHLFLNKDAPYAWQDWSNMYGQAVLPATSPPTQNLEVEICGGMVLEVTNGGVLVVGDPGSNKRAEIRFKAGSTLILGDEGQLVIANNSRLIIEPGATFIYQKGAEINLITGTSILQIEGEWIIEEYADFSFEGWGFVRTDLPDNNGGPNITHGRYSSISLIGNQKDEHKILEVVDGSHFMTQHDNCDMSVTFGSGIIEMGTRARIDVTDSQLNLDWLWVRSLPGAADQHHGITVNRAPTAVRYTDIFNGSTGLHITMDPKLMNCSNTLGFTTVVHSNFINCGTGLFTQGGGVHLAAVTFQENDYGWQARQIQRDCQVGDNVARSHRYSAYDLEGDSKSHLVSVDRSLIFANREGLKGDMGLELELSCDSIANNGVGIRAGNDVMVLMADEAYNYLGGNRKSILLKNARGIDLDEGYNMLENTPIPGAGGQAISGSLASPPDTIPIPADHNYWKQSVLGPGSVPPSSTIAEVWLHDTPATTYTFSDASPLSARVGGPAYCRLFGGGSQPVPSGSKVELPATQLPVAQLRQNIPNPGRYTTRIPYYLPETAGESEIWVFDLVTGRKIQRLVLREPGEGSVQLDRGDLSPGVYGYSLVVDGKVIATRKLVWMN